MFSSSSRMAAILSASTAFGLGGGARLSSATFTRGPAQTPWHIHPWVLFIFAAKAESHAVRVCVCACVHACARACVHACIRLRVIRCAARRRWLLSSSCSTAVKYLAPLNDESCTLQCGMIISAMARGRESYSQRVSTVAVVSAIVCARRKSDRISNGSSAASLCAVHRSSTGSDGARSLSTITRMRRADSLASSHLHTTASMAVGRDAT